MSRLILFYLALVGASALAQEERSRVVSIERPAVVNKFAVDPVQTRTMFVQALQAYTGQKNVGAAWQQLGIKSSDVVGLKINAALGQVMGTRRALIDAVVETLGSAGVRPSQIIIWDKQNYELENAGWLPQPEGVFPAVRSVISQTGFDGQQFYVSEILGKLIWGDFLFRGKQPTKADLLKAAEKVAKKHSGETEDAQKNRTDVEEQTSNKSYFAKLLTQTCTKIINLPAMSDHASYGLDGCLSSLAIASVDNTRRFADERVGGDPAIAEILDRDLFRKKVVLHVMDGLVAQYAGGPQFVPLYTQSAGLLYMGVDPVAIDTLALARLEAWRVEAKIVPIQPRAKHIAGAAALGLGQTETSRIELINLK